MLCLSPINTASRLLSFCSVAQEFWSKIIFSCSHLVLIWQTNKSWTSWNLHKISTNLWKSSFLSLYGTGAPLPAGSGVPLPAPLASSARTRLAALILWCLVCRPEEWKHYLSFISVCLGVFFSGLLSFSIMFQNWCLIQHLRTPKEHVFYASPIVYIQDGWDCMVSGWGEVYRAPYSANIESKPQFTLGQWASILAKTFAKAGIHTLKTFFVQSLVLIISLQAIYTHVVNSAV